MDLVPTENPDIKDEAQRIHSIGLTLKLFTDQIRKKRLPKTFTGNYELREERIVTPDNYDAFLSEFEDVP